MREAVETMRTELAGLVDRIAAVEARQMTTAASLESLGVRVGPLDPQHDEGVTGSLAEIRSRLHSLETATENAARKAAQAAQEAEAENLRQKAQDKLIEERRMTCRLSKATGRLQQLGVARAFGAWAFVARKAREQRQRDQWEKSLTERADQIAASASQDQKKQAEEVALVNDAMAALEAQVYL